MSLFPDTSGGYYDDTGHWQCLKFCFVYCGSRCNCQAPGGVEYNPLFDKSKQEQAEKAADPLPNSQE